MILYQVQPLIQLNIFLPNINIMLIKLSITVIVSALTLLRMASCVEEVHNHLTHLHQTKITISSMHEDRSKHSHVLHNYIYNYPLVFLKTHQINSIIFIHSMEWSQNSHPEQLNFNIAKFSSPTAMLVTLSSHHLLWQNFDIGIILHNFKYRPDLFFGETQILNPSPSKTFIQYLIMIPKPFRYNKYVSYITGIQAKSPSSSYSVDLEEDFLSNGQLRFIVKVGEQMSLTKLFVSYIAYSQSSNNLKKSGEFYFQDIKQKAYEGLRSDVPVTQHYIFGINRLKFQSDTSLFKIHFQIVSQYVFQISVDQLLDYLSVRYFAISALPNQICKHQNSFIYSEGWKNYCLPQCKGDTWIKNYSSGGRACVKCPNLLNMTLPSHRKGCDCALGFFIEGQRCVSFMDIGPKKKDMMQVRTQNCEGPHMIMKGSGQCDCLSGFTKNSERQCVSICGNGFWNGYQCTYCDSGTYVWEDLRQCKSCTSQCQFCQNYNSCSKCKNGFYRTSDGVCAEICGDGRKFNFQCDDGNVFDNDGCSSSCEVQKGFACSGGSPQNKDRCWRISFTVKRISQQLAISSILLDYKLDPNPQTRYSEQQLQKMISIAIEDKKNYPSKILLSHDEKDYCKIRIALNYNNLPNEDFEIQIRFVFPDGKFLTQIYKTNFFTVYSVFNSRFNSRQSL